MKEKKVQATAKPKKRGRPQGELRKWYEENLPEIKPAHYDGESVELWDVEVPEIDGVITVEIPKGYVIIPPELTSEKSPANIGQTARHAKNVKNMDVDFVVHHIPTDVQVAKNKTKEVQLFAVEVR